MNRFSALRPVLLTAAILALMACAISSPLHAQITGDILVSVSDATGGVIPNAAVTVRSLGTGTQRTAPTDSDGTVRFTQLAIGNYEVKVEASGFAARVTQTQVGSAAIARVTAQLEVSTSKQEVVVAETAQQLNVVNAQLQTSTEQADIRDLPIAQSGVLGLSGTAPGVVPVTPRNPFLGLGSFNSNGGRGRGNNITLDNATATDVSTTGGAGLGTVPLDAIKEVNIITNNFSAEFGRNSSAQVQILTQNGTNDFHGSLFEFVRNNIFNARDYFDRTGSASIVRDNDWGATGGGRIIKNKLFYYGTYQEQKIRGSGGTRIASVPTPAQVGGNIDPTAKALLAQMQVPTDPSGTVSNSASNVSNNWSLSGRMDANITDRDFFYLRYGYQNAKTSSAGLTFINSNLPTNGATSVNAPQNATVSETHTFSPALVNTFLASFGRSRPGFAPIAQFGGPEIDFLDGTSTFGIWSGVPQGRVQNTFQYTDTLGMVRGKHQFKFGADINRVQANSYFDANVRGTLTFLTLSDFLSGKPFQYSQRFGGSVRGNRITNAYFFAQDDFRVSRFLTINLGMRFEGNSGVNEVNNILSNLDLTSNKPLGGAGTGAFGSFYTGGTYFNPTHNWAPRFGFAWNPHGGKTSIRGGYGISYDFIYLNPITNGRFLPPYMYLFSLPNTQITGANSFANLAAGTSAFQGTGAATIGTFGTSILNFGSATPIDRNLKNPQVQQFSLTIQRELPLGLVGQISYSGTKGNFLQRTRPLNFLAPGQFTPPATLAEQQAQQASGLYSKLNAGLNAPFSAYSNRIDPRFDNLSFVDASANSNYHSMQLNVSRRFHNGYSFNAAFTWSKSIDDVSDALGVLANDSASQQDPFNNRNNRAVSEFNVPRRFVLTHTIAPRILPTLRNPFLKGVLQGWELSGIFQAQSGFPVNLFSGSAAGLADPTLLGGNDSVRPNLVGPVSIPFRPNPGLGGKNPNLVTASGLAQPLVGAFGTLGRNVLTLNPLVQADFTFGKEFAIKERIKARFQAQVYNAFNNTTFSRPGATLSAPSTFGYYTDTDTDSRNMTMTIRLIW